jgi:hypothetical protein
MVCHNKNYDENYRTRNNPPPSTWPNNQETEKTVQESTYRDNTQHRNNIQQTGIYRYITATILIPINNPQLCILYFKTKNIPDTRRDSSRKSHIETVSNEEIIYWFKTVILAKIRVYEHNNNSQCQCQSTFCGLVYYLSILYTYLWWTFYIHKNPISPAFLPYVQNLSNCVSKYW